ncbi:restriction endonuclease subunit S [Sansalvadorimonas sp. 2012CJ34-2]|uniref:Restriction endonuclease subunit S n=1 Tax=Parendozoicomonas callyspongiae TaxID=2942213 RepID=A0ABT0PJE4_9GAMM|nr:restriction endonuclease subunit S [Sansalvadorimonas sp. 2012CJ34-2]MCL6271469.1 restriction endonuclease subunit S [Sansalvadorimonas sp. 2012CJ34-2]
MSDVENLITDNIANWALAVQKRNATGRGSSKKVELYGIKKLRELIRELAVRGKLVTQNPEDEPASALLNRIASEKAQLFESKEIKKPRKFLDITENEKPFDIPAGWAWARLEDIGREWGQKKPDQQFTYIDVGAINKELGYISEPNILEAGEAPSRARKLVKEGTVIYSTVRPYLLNIAVINQAFDPEPIASTAFAILHPMGGMSGSFIYRYLRSPSFVKYVESCQTGIAYPAINDKQFFSGVIPVPPEAEQIRIDAKAQELMSLCDQLEQQTESSLTAHATLVENLLATLTSSIDAAELEQNWLRIAEHFTTLFTTEESIDQLKQTVLQLAVMGKLVPQNPNDEPASVLLEKIAAEKAQLIKEKKIKKHPKVQPIGGLGDLPSTWEKIVVQDFADIRLGSTPSRTEPTYWNGEIPWVSSGEVAHEIIWDTKEKITPEGLSKSSTSIIPARSLLMAIIGQGKTRGQTALLGIDACTNQNIAAFVFNENFVVPEFVWIWAKSKYHAHRGGGHGGAQPALNGKKVRSFSFPLPPTDEQQRIVEKVDELLAICNQLQTHLQQAQQTRLHLADAMVEGALS